jgi:deazaflavin-dependent oxidoreductase (nitroreductase family)
MTDQISRTKTIPVAEVAGGAAAVHLSTGQAWRVLGTATMAVLGHVTPDGAPRTSGVIYEIVDHRLYIAVAPDSWKARQIRSGDQVSVTVLVRRGGVLSLLFPIPPATITFHGRASVHPAGSPEAALLLDRLKKLLPPERRVSACLIGVAPEGSFLTYGIGVPLMAMRHPQAARARVAVEPPHSQQNSSVPGYVDTGGLPDSRSGEAIPYLPPRWFIRAAWKVHRALFDLTRGRRGLWPARAGRSGAMRVSTVGRRSGQERPVILAYFEDGPNLVTLAMNGWGEGEPAWWLNLKAHPQARVQLVTGTRDVVARAASGRERERLWDRWRSLDKNLDGYARRRSTETAVVVLEPRPADESAR